jgi:2,4-dienoyl-CoA reductase-like NADH-dependent reductase (Old Yellow Enzyme family)
MTANTDVLFQPISLGNLNLKNRVVMAPMTRQMSPNNIANEAVAEYYRKRAAGGVGLIITEGTCVNHPAGNMSLGIPQIFGETPLAGWKKTVDAVHAVGGKIMPQLWHVGSARRKGSEPNPDVPGFGPSGMSTPGKVRCHVMSEEDIADVIAAFAQGAKDAKSIGFDGVEIHGAHGYLIDQFFWAGLNHREDKWGGVVANRSRFAIEILKAIRKEVGDDFPIILRWSQWKQQEYTAKLAENPQELEEFLGPLSDAGVDVFHCSARRFWEAEFEDSDLNLAGWSKKLTGKPTITVGSVGLDNDFIASPQEGVMFSEANPASIENLLERMNRNEFDMVAIGRALIANANWANLVRAGKEAELKAYTKEMLASLE